MSAYCNTPESLRNLCVNCPYDTCVSDDRGCAEYQKAQECEKNGTPYTMPNDWHPGARSNAAVQNCLNEAFSKIGRSPETRSTIPKPTVAKKTKQKPATKNTERETLALYNAAINAMRALWAAEDSVGALTPIPDAIMQLVRARAERFEHLIDWDMIEKQQGGNP